MALQKDSVDQGISTRHLNFRFTHTIMRLSSCNGFNQLSTQAFNLADWEIKEQQINREANKSEELKLIVDMFMEINLPTSRRVLEKLDELFVD
ncbi:unnamed protein product [Mesocestoides corti]|uniref:Uncharacterized protein n=1 Tax=Mesocestoides corti TaxID=53468 RepID=A0A0R3U938_MESCO|nr:unnamed protein product [Mesocestoides corti]